MNIKGFKWNCEMPDVMAWWLSQNPPTCVSCSDARNAALEERMELLESLLRLAYSEHEDDPRWSGWADAARTALEDKT